MGPEVWYPIEGYEGYYQVSSYGRVRSVDRTVRFRNGHTRHYTGKVLMLRYHNGYAMVNLNKNGQLREHYVHRLVAENFLLHFKGKDWVNHINGIKSDNRVENLEWCTPGENNEHARNTGLTTINISGILRSNVSKQKKVVIRLHDGTCHVEPSALDMAKYCIANRLINRDEYSLRYAIRYACQSGAICGGYKFDYT